MKFRSLNPLPILIIIAISLIIATRPANAQIDKPPRIPVTSPINLSFDFSCKDVASVQVAIDDETKDIIVRQILVPDCQGKSVQTVHTKLYFDTFERLTPAHLSISAYDAETRWIWTISEDIVFTEVKTPMRYIFKAENPLTITEPIDGTSITSRQFQVQGSIRVDGSRYAYIELVSDEGRVLGSALVSILSSATDGQWEFDLPLKVTSTSYTGGARLTMQQFGLDIYGIESLTSVLLRLE